ncbi:MAG TPA: hypothetical protein VG778_06745 [Blastocatellia bacterium]|nr:hypothetical protein [Blastocatellia bacterium]
MGDEFTPEFERVTTPEQGEIDHALELTLRYNRMKELREARKPDLYGPGIDFYEEERIIAEQRVKW